MTLESLINWLVRVNPWNGVKLLFLFGLLLYLVFAVVVVRQVNLMKKALNGALELPLTLAVWIHLGTALFVFWLALVFL
jgi:hypothetical protein